MFTKGRTVSSSIPSNKNNQQSSECAQCYGTCLWPVRSPWFFPQQHTVQYRYCTVEGKFPYRSSWRGNKKVFFAHAQWKQLFFTHARLEMLTNILSISFAAAIIYYVSRTRSRWCCVHPAAQFCIYYYFLTIFRACAVGGAAAWWLGEEEHPAAERDHGAASQAAGHEVRRSDRRCATTASISG